MSEGLLWMPDDTLQTLADEIDRAARHFQTKTGKRPAICRMKAHGIPSGIKTVYGIRIVPDETITPGHFLLCYEEVENG